MASLTSLWVNGSPWSRYRLIRQRGQGAYGQVWEAEDPEGQRIAPQLLPCGASRTASREGRGIQQIRQLAPPHLVRIDHIWAERDTVIVTMELADGSLLDLLDVSLEEFGQAFTR